MKKSTSIQIFGDMFRQRREILKRTTKAVACELGIGEQYIIDFEAGKTLESVLLEWIYLLASCLVFIPNKKIKILIKKADPIDRPR